MPVDPALDDDAFQEVHEADALDRGAVHPVVAAVDADHRVHGGVGPLGQVPLHVGITGSQSGQRSEVPTRRRARDRDEVAIPAELVDVGPGPGDGGFDVGEVLGPRMIGRDAVVDRQAYPAHLGEVRHQRITLQDPAAVHPRATGQEQHHRRRLGGEFLRPPDVEDLRGAVAVPHRGSVDLATVFQCLPDRRRAFGRGPGDRETFGGHHAVQRGPGHLARGVADTPDAHRRHPAEWLEVSADDGQGRRRTLAASRYSAGPAFISQRARVVQVGPGYRVSGRTVISRG